MNDGGSVFEVRTNGGHWTDGRTDGRMGVRLKWPTGDGRIIILVQMIAT